MLKNLLPSKTIWKNLNRQFFFDTNCNFEDAVIVEPSYNKYIPLIIPYFNAASLIVNSCFAPKSNPIFSVDIKKLEKYYDIRKMYTPCIECLFSMTLNNADESFERLFYDSIRMGGRRFSNSEVIQALPFGKSKPLTTISEVLYNKLTKDFNMGAESMGWFKLSGIIAAASKFIESTHQNDLAQYQLIYRY